MPNDNVQDRNFRQLWCIFQILVLVQAPKTAVKVQKNKNNPYVYNRDLTGRDLLGPELFYLVK